MSNHVVWNMEPHLFHLVNTLPLYSIPIISSSGYLSHETSLDWAQCSWRLGPRLGFELFEFAPKNNMNILALHEKYNVVNSAI